MLFRSANELVDLVISCGRQLALPRTALAGWFAWLRHSGGEIVVVRQEQALLPMLRSFEVKPVYLLCSRCWGGFSRAGHCRQYSYHINRNLKERAKARKRLYQSNVWKRNRSAVIFFRNSLHGFNYGGVWFAE